MSAQQSTPDSILNECEPIIRGDRDNDLDQLVASPRLGVAIHAAWKRLGKLSCYDMPSGKLEAFCQFVEYRLDVTVPEWWRSGLVHHVTNLGKAELVARYSDGIQDTSSVQVSGGSLLIRCGQSSTQLRLSDLRGGLAKKQGVQLNASYFATCEHAGSIVLVYSTNVHAYIEYVIVSICCESSRLQWRHVVPKCWLRSYEAVPTPVCSLVANSRGEIGVFGAAMHGQGYIVGVFSKSGNCECVFNTDMYDRALLGQSFRIDPRECGRCVAPDYE